jgi:hypothetical protein
MAEEPKIKPVFNEQKLSKDDQKDFDFYKQRILELQEARKDQYGTNIETIWMDADKDYVPHRLMPKSGTRAIVTDEEKGWRSSFVQLGTDDWQSDISQPNPYIKIQTALAILIDQNPSGVFMPTKKQYQATTELMKQLYQRSWDYAKSKQQLKLFTFNLAKYGWACARTYPLLITRSVKVPREFNPEDPAETRWDKKEVIEFNDIMRDNLDPWNVWMDDMARPNSEFSIRDWAWRKVYGFDAAEEEFGKYPMWKYVQPGGTTTDRITGAKAPDKKYKDTSLVEIYFYENRLKDLFMVVANGVPIIIEPLPVSDSKGLKKLSLWQAYWTLRHAESPYGIGLYEAMRHDQAMLDRLRNMTLDQLTLSIYKMFFYQGTQSLTETGDIKIKPGVGKQTLDPKNITWLDVPGPGAQAWTGLEMLKKDMEDSSGITETLQGQITGKTAFEIAQAKEAALKRLKTPLDNITDALNTEAYITISLAQLLYSVPEVYAIEDPALIEAYLQETQSDPDLYDRDEEGTFNAKVFPEFPMNIETDKEGALVETKETAFFRIKPRFLSWEGVINVKSQSILTPSKQVDKQQELEMWNMLIPLLAQPPELYKKVAESIIKLYDKEPKDILPASWLLPPQAPQVMPMGQEVAPGQAPQAETLVPSTEVQPQGQINSASSMLAQPFR